MVTFLTDWLHRTLRTAGPVSAVTTAAVALCGKAEGNAVAPLNAVSHILWGDEAAREDDLDVEHTAAGMAINAAAVASWAAVYELGFGREARRGNAMTALVGGAAVSALAYVTDYYVVPGRLTPGFEKRLSGKSMFAVYAALALSLPIMSLVEADWASSRQMVRRPR